MTEGKIPHTGLEREEIHRYFDSLRKEDCRFEEGKTFGLVYSLDERHRQLMSEVHTKFLEENYLNPLAFKSIRQLETEVVQMGVSLTNGDSSSVGCITSGGSESIFLACKTYRDRFLSKCLKSTKPNIVLPKSGHVAFEKAAEILGLDVRKVSLGDDCRADTEAIQRAVNKRTCLIVLSAPQYPHGVIDPIEKVAKFAKEKGIPLHIDACIGGFLLPWLEKLGEPVRLWDFRVDGVSSISLDIHKYGYCPKGASLLLYKEMDLMQHQFFVSTDWPGGVYASGVLAGSRPGSAIAGAYASMVSLGEEGFLRESRKVLRARKALIDGVKAISELQPVAMPEAGCLALHSIDSRVSIFAVADQLSKKGWFLDRQQDPESIHFTLMSNHEAQIPNLIESLKSGVKAVLDNPSLSDQGEAMMYGMMAKSPIRSLVRSNVLDFMKKLYGGGEAPAVGEDSVQLPPGGKLFLKVFGRRSRSPETRLD